MEIKERFVRRPTYKVEEFNPFVEIDSVEAFSVDSDGLKESVSPEEFFEGMAKNGIWGYIDFEEQTIYVWTDAAAGYYDLVCFFAHELGHSVKSRYVNPEDCELEEERAEDYAWVACEAVRMADDYFTRYVR